MARRLADTLETLRGIGGILFCIVFVAFWIGHVRHTRYLDHSIKPSLVQLNGEVSGIVSAFSGTQVGRNYTADKYGSRAVMAQFETPDPLDLGQVGAASGPMARLGWTRSERRWGERYEFCKDDMVAEISKIEALRYAVDINWGSADAYCGR